MQQVAVNSAPPYITHYDAPDAGEAAHWAICWETSSGERGPCSAVTRWTIAGKRYNAAAGEQARRHYALRYALHRYFP